MGFFKRSDYNQIEVYKIINNIQYLFWNKIKFSMPQRNNDSAIIL